MINIYDRLWYVTRATDDGKLSQRRFKIPTTGLQKEVSFTEMWDYLDPILSNLDLAGLVNTEMHKESADLHTKTASALFGVDCQDVTGEQRERAKAFNYGRLYSVDLESVLTLLKMEDK